MSAHLQTAGSCISIADFSARFEFHFFEKEEFHFSLRLGKLKTFFFTCNLTLLKLYLCLQNCGCSETLNPQICFKKQKRVICTISLYRVNPTGKHSNRVMIISVLHLFQTKRNKTVHIRDQFKGKLVS